jgi:hypothetical protein
MMITICNLAIEVGKELRALGYVCSVYHGKDENIEENGHTHLMNKTEDFKDVNENW